ncbi:hypothetical protein RFI_36510 [Reticulomyxa filosa]|uniref:Uncharacterized protein n=1 Tax=Reticulomyxa filosa TaxID=46433 RepID=X6LJQ4_RETFI|nr:hypothetical protein RFI_36510 [Reticulomyxa filosa]|eukprot:ETO00930.1 hypothetical protein RFI_36510 [Reticulomyxa filosa]
MTMEKRINYSKKLKEMEMLFAQMKEDNVVPLFRMDDGHSVCDLHSHDFQQSIARWNSRVVKLQLQILQDTIFPWIHLHANSFHTSTSSLVDLTHWKQEYFQCCKQLKLHELQVSLKKKKKMDIERRTTVYNKK